MEISKMTKKKRKEFYAKNRVTFGMNTGTITHKGYKDTLRRENKMICRNYLKEDFIWEKN